MSTYSDDDAAAIIGQYPDTWTGRRDRLATTLLHRLALRVSEAVSIRVQDFNPANGTLAVGRLKRRGVVVTVFPLPDDLVADIAAWAAELPAGCVWLFPTRRGLPLHRTRLYRSIRAAAEAVGIDGATCHRFRHTGITNLVERRDENGNNVFDIHESQHLAGHADIRTTARYLHVNQKRLEGKREWL